VVRSALKVKRSRQRSLAWVTQSPGGVSPAVVAGDASGDASTGEQEAVVTRHAKEAFARYLVRSWRQG
jgi:hypothetical protein